MSGHPHVGHGSSLAVWSPGRDPEVTAPSGQSPHEAGSERQERLRGAVSGADGSCILEPEAGCPGGGLVPWGCSSAGAWGRRLVAPAVTCLPIHSTNTGMWPLEAPYCGVWGAPNLCWMPGRRRASQTTISLNTCLASTSPQLGSPSCCLPSFVPQKWSALPLVEQPSSGWGAPAQKAHVGLLDRRSVHLSSDPSSGLLPPPPYQLPGQASWTRPHALLVEQDSKGGRGGSFPTGPSTCRGCPLTTTPPPAHLGEAEAAARSPVDQRWALAQDAAVILSRRRASQALRVLRVVTCPQEPRGSRVQLQPSLSSGRGRPMNTEQQKRDRDGPMVFQPSSRLLLTPAHSCSQGGLPDKQISGFQINNFLLK